MCEKCACVNNTQLHILLHAHLGMLLGVPIIVTFDKFSLFARTLQEWNRLPRQVALAKSLESFKEATTKYKTVGKVTCFSHPSPSFPLFQSYTVFCTDVFNIGFGGEGGYKKHCPHLKLS